MWLALQAWCCMMSATTGSGAPLHRASLLWSRCRQGWLEVCGFQCLISSSKAAFRQMLQESGVDRCVPGAGVRQAMETSTHRCWARACWTASRRPA